MRKKITKTIDINKQSENEADVNAQANCYLSMSNLYNFSNKLKMEKTVDNNSSIKVKRLIQEVINNAAKYPKNVYAQYYAALAISMINDEGNKTQLIYLNKALKINTLFLPALIKRCELLYEKKDLLSALIDLMQIKQLIKNNIPNSELKTYFLTENELSKNVKKLNEQLLVDPQLLSNIKELKKAKNNDPVLNNAVKINNETNKEAKIEKHVEKLKQMKFEVKNQGKEIEKENYEQLKKTNQQLMSVINSMHAKTGSIPEITNNLLVTTLKLKNNLLERYQKFKTLIIEKNNRKKYNPKYIKFHISIYLKILLNLESNIKLLEEMSSQNQKNTMLIELLLYQENRDFKGYIGNYLNLARIMNIDTSNFDNPFKNFLRRCGVEELRRDYIDYNDHNFSWLYNENKKNFNGLNNFLYLSDILNKKMTIDNKKIILDLMSTVKEKNEKTFFQFILKFSRTFFNDLALEEELEEYIHEFLHLHKHKFFNFLKLTIPHFPSWLLSYKTNFQLISRQPTQKDFQVGEVVIFFELQDQFLYDSEVVYLWKVWTASDKKDYSITSHGYFSTHEKYLPQKYLPLLNYCKHLTLFQNNEKGKVKKIIVKDDVLKHYLNRKLSRLLPKEIQLIKDILINKLLDIYKKEDSFFLLSNLFNLSSNKYYSSVESVFTSKLNAFFAKTLFFKKTKKQVKTQENINENINTEKEEDTKNSKKKNSKHSNNDYLPNYKF